MTRTDRIVETILKLIDAGHLAPGQRVASLRSASQEYGVSKNTIVEAYDRLAALGALEPRAGSGFYVVPSRRATAALRPPHVVEATDTVSLLRQQLDQHYEVRVGDGRPPADWMEGSELGRHLRLPGARAESAAEHGYGPPAGYEPLRARIAQMLIERSIQAAPDQILMTFGANHGLDLIARHFIEPGDAVLVDSPGYYPLFAKLRLVRANIVPVLRTPDGPDLDDLERKAAQTRPKLFFTQALAHNPTGTSMPLAQMHRLVQAGERHGFMIVEDDPFADILPPLLPRLAALDQLNRVLYVGTFSKTLSASLRSGYIAGPQGLIASLTDVKMLSVVNSSGYVEQVIHDLIARGHYRRHLRRLQNRVVQATASTMAQLARLGFTGIRPPSGGYYVWCPLPGGDDLELSRRAAAQGIFIAPSTIFSVDAVGYTPAMRVNIAYADHPKFLDFLSRQHGG